MKKILITGHHGFIGSHLVPLLLSKNYKITGISNKKSNNNKIIEIQKDIQKIESSDIDEYTSIIHLAAITDFLYCQQHPTECFQTNIFGTQKLLDLARKKNCKFLYVSTSHVYGSPNKLPINEEHSRNATSIYAASKIGGEVCCESYAQSYGMDVSIVRLFSVYGPHSPDHLVTTKMISQLLNSGSIKLGNLYPKRDFIYVTDVVRAIEIVLRKSRDFHIYNIGTGHSYSILQIFNMLKKISKIDCSVESSMSNLRKMDIPNIISDPSKIKKLGWKPMVSLEEGIRMTFEWYKKNTINLK